MFKTFETNGNINLAINEKITVISLETVLFTVGLFFI